MRGQSDPGGQIEGQSDPERSGDSDPGADETIREVRKGFGPRSVATTRVRRLTGQRPAERTRPKKR